MTDKVEKLSKRLNSKKLAKAYPRVERENKALSPEYLSDDVSQYYPPAQGDSVYAAAKEPPFDKYKLAFEVRLEELPSHNDVLIYRMLKLLYGEPDILGANVSANPEKPIVYVGAGIDWGFTVRILPNLFAEIRSVHSNVRQRLRFWIDEIPETKEERASYGKKMFRFHEAFIDAIERNGHLFNEEEEFTSFEQRDYAVSNIFSERYRAAERLLELAEKEDVPAVKRDLRVDEVLDVSTVGAIYLSSAIQFVISLEALINTILALLLKDEFRSKEYERATTRADLDVRLITAHVFCSGFSKQVLIPKTDLWNRMLKLRDFRNEVVHGNVTSDHYVYALREDGNTFYYCPVTDYRGRKAEAKASRNYPTTMAQVNRKTVLEIRQTVDDLVQSLISAADEDRRHWIEGWIWEAVIPESDPFIVWKQSELKPTLPG